MTEAGRYEQPDEFTGISGLVGDEGVDEETLRSLVTFEDDGRRVGGSVVLENGAAVVVSPGVGPDEDGWVSYSRGPGDPGTTYPLSAVEAYLDRTDADGNDQQTA